MMTMGNVNPSAFFAMDAIRLLSALTVRLSSGIVNYVGDKILVDNSKEG